MIETKFVAQDTIVKVIEMNEETTYDKLPPKVYSVSHSEFIGYFLTIKKDRFNVPDKIFGNVLKKVDKVLTSYNDRKDSTGILLTGSKGAGKTLFAELLSNEMISKGIPVILVELPYSGPDFDNFVNSLGECVLYFDEFAKTYRNINNNNPQEGLLSLFDGTGSQKRLIITVDNSENSICEFMLNRPSRMMYHFKYAKLDESSITEFCEYKNINEKIIKDIITLSYRINQFSFDILKIIIEEYKRFGEPIDEIIKDLNIQINEFHQKIKILQITDKNTEERYITDDLYKIVNKPLEEYDSTYICYYKNSDKENSCGTYIQIGDIKFTKDKIIIYENDYCVIVAEDIQETNNYMKFLMC